jgi:uncharacterized protein YceH (UPF0502 family)
MSGAEQAAGRGPWPVLDLLERRVLGVLVEKAKTTAESYPLSVNALVTGCNQKSNRDPLLDVSDLEVEEVLPRLQKRGLVARVTGSRVERWRHLLYEAWHVDKVDLAVLAELLLRGPQTEGELRARASRMEAIDDLDALKKALRPLVERRLVVYLTAEDRRGAVVTHGFHDPADLAVLRSRAAAQPADSPASHVPAAAPAPPRADPALEAGLAEVRREVAALREDNAALKRQLAEAQAAVAALRADLAALKQALGA